MVATTATMKASTPPLADTARYDRLRGDGAADGEDSTVEASHEA
jgi:hypothetical protein